MTLAERGSEDAVPFVPQYMPPVPKKKGRARNDEWFIVPRPGTTFYNGYCVVCRRGNNWGHIQGNDHVRHMRDPDNIAWYLFQNNAVELYDLDMPEEVARRYWHYVEEAKEEAKEKGSKGALEAKRSSLLPGAAIKVPPPTPLAAAKAAASGSGLAPMYSVELSPTLRVRPCDVARMASSNSEVAVSPGGAEQESLGEWALLTCGAGSEPMQEVYIADPEGRRTPSAEEAEHLVSLWGFWKIITFRTLFEWVNPSGAAELAHLDGMSTSSFLECLEACGMKRASCWDERSAPFLNGEFKVRPPANEHPRGCRILNEAGLPPPGVREDMLRLVKILLLGDSGLRLYFEKKKSKNAKNKHCHPMITHWDKLMPRISRRPRGS